MKRRLLVGVALSAGLFVEGCFNPNIGGFETRTGEYYQETKSGRSVWYAQDIHIPIVTQVLGLARPFGLIADVCIVNPVWDTLMLPIDACFARHGRYIRVVDETGEPVAGAEVSVVGRYDRQLPKSVSDVSTTDAEGLASVPRLKSNYAFTDVQVVAEGFHRLHRRFKDGEGAQSVKDVQGRDVLTLAVSRPLRPTALPRHGVWLPDAVTAEDRRQGGSWGYDLLRQDWMPPFGKGERADVVFELHVPGEVESEEVGDLAIRAPGTDDGFLVRPLTPGAVRDTFCTDREAPNAVDYQPEVRLGDFTESYYAFRVRTEKDASGRIVSAHYGALIPRHDARFPYYLTVITNPNPNDRSLEPKED